MRKKPLIIIVVGIALYFISLFNGFVWDDEVLSSPHAETMQSYFRPVMSFLHSIFFTALGGSPFIFHLFSVIFHIATALLLYYLFKRFFSEILALFFSLLFLVHPANVEAVCFASALQEVLFTFTGITGLYLLVRSKTISDITLLFSVSLFTCALLMKETSIVFFALSFCYLYLFHRKNVVWMYCAFSLIAVCGYLTARFMSGVTLPQGEGLFPIMRVPIMTRFITVPSIIFFYLKTFFFPLNLAIAQNWVVQSLSFASFILPLILELMLLTMSIFYILKTRNKKFLFFFLWFLIGLLPHLQIVPLNMTVAERWLYFPMIGLLGMIASFWQSEVIRAPACRQAGPESSTDPGVLRRHVGVPRMTIIIFILSLFFLRSFVRTLDWQNGLSLFSRDIRRDSSFDLQNNMGVELFRVRKYAQAKTYFELSTRLAPYWWVNWNNLGAAYQQEDNLVQAKMYYEKAIQNGEYQQAYENLAKILVLYVKDKQKTDEFLKKALTLFPESATLQKLQIYYQKSR